MADLSKRAHKAKKLFYNITDEYDAKELEAAIKRADNDFSFLEPYWKNLILKAEALEAKIEALPYNERREYLKELYIEQKRKRQKVWEKSLSPGYRELIEKIREKKDR